jgi:hypothetical protein
MHLNMSAICRSQNVQTVLDFTPCVFQYLMCHRSSRIFDSCTKFNHTTKFWKEYLVPYTAPPPSKNPVGLYRGARGPRDWSVSPNPSVWKSLIQNLSLRLQCGRARPCWKKTFGWSCAICRTANNSIISRWFVLFTVFSWKKGPITSCALLMRDTTCVLKLFQSSLDGLSSRCLFSIFPTVKSLHFNNWFCLPVPQHRYCLLLVRNCHFAFVSCVRFSSPTICQEIN